MCKFVLAQKSQFRLRSDLNRCLRTTRPSKRLVGAARLVISRVDSKTSMNTLVVPAMRTLFVLICSFALTCAARVDQANNNGIHAKLSHHAVRGKRTPGGSAHASPSTHGKHPTGGSRHVQHMQTSQHIPAGRHPAGFRRAARQKAELTPTPTPTATPTPFPTDDSTATPNAASSAPGH
jgi:hypothetical protein